jgi:ABC-type multidrug transport system fused ATPase/permease subunit
MGTATDRIASRLRKELFNSYMETDIELYDAEKNGEMVREVYFLTLCSIPFTRPDFYRLYSVLRYTLLITSHSTPSQQLTLLEKDAQSAAECVTDRLADGLRCSNSSLNGLITLSRISPQLCIVALSTVPFVGIGGVLLSKYSKKWAERLRKLESETTTYALERFNMLSTVKLNSRENYEKGTYANYMLECSDIAQSRHFYQGSFMSFNVIATNIAVFAVMKVGGGLIQSAHDGWLSYAVRNAGASRAVRNLSWCSRLRAR